MAFLRLIPSQGSQAPIEITRDRMIVGREATCDVVVSDGSVSRKHAILEQRGGTAWAVVDQGSANGTFLNSERVTDTLIQNGQELRFGSMAFRVDLEDESATILTSSPDATILQDSPIKPTPPAIAPPAPPPPPAVKPPAVKPPAPPWAAPPSAPKVTAAPPLPKDPVSPPPAVAPVPPPLPPKPAAAPPPPVPPPLPPRPATAARVVTPVTGDAPPPAKKARGPLFWVGGGCCGCLVLVLVFLGVIGGGAYFMTSGAVEAVRAQIADVKKGDMAAAYGRMSEEYRSRHTMEDFAAFVERHPSLKQNTDSTFSSRNVKNDTATLAGSLAGANAVKEDVAYTLVKENGEWKITTIAFGDDTGEPIADPGGGTTDGGSGGSLRLETLSTEKSQDPAGQVVAIKVRATGFGTDGSADAPRADLLLDLETLGPGGRKLPDLSRMELQSRDHPDSVSPATADFDITVTLRDATPGDYVARLTVRDQIGRDIKTQDVPFTLP